MDLQLNGRHALVTAASRGLGRAIACGLATEGAEVVAVARNAESLRALADQSAGLRGSITTRNCDLTDASAIARLGEALEQTEILVLNTGGPPPGPIVDVPDTVWIQQFESMFLSVVRLTRLALPGMLERRFGRIMVVVSSGVLEPIPNLGISNSLRMAVVGWAKTLANEVAGSGITVNCLAPGRIATDRVAQLDQGRAQREGISIEEVERQARRLIPAGRYGDADEFASVATFLAGAGAAYVTGGVIRIDGGMIRGA
jgi:3-oxoacyl-[acyl-carrier protein] reductase